MSRAKKKTRQRSNRFKKTAKRLAAYSAAAAATIMTTQDRSAEAEEVVWDIPDVQAWGVGNPNILFNMENGTYKTDSGSSGYIYNNTADGSFGVGGPFTYIYAPAGSDLAGFVNPSVGFGNMAVNPSVLAPSSSVTSKNLFGGRNDFQPTYGNFANLDSNFYCAYQIGGIVGLRFKIGSGPPGDFHYGWAQISTRPDGGVILHGFGYNDEVNAPSHPPDGGTVDSVAETFCPTSWNLFRGILLEGDLDSFCGDDDNELRFNPGITINVTEAPVWPEVFGNVGAPGDICNFLSVTSNVGTPGLTYTVEARNYVTGERDIIGTQEGSFNAEQTVTYLLTSDHIEANGDVESRIGWRKTGLTINFPWEVRIDDVSWIVQ